LRDFGFNALRGFSLLTSQESSFERKYTKLEQKPQVAGVCGEFNRTGPEVILPVPYCTGLTPLKPENQMIFSSCEAVLSPLYCVRLTFIIYKKRYEDIACISSYAGSAILFLKILAMQLYLGRRSPQVSAV
jgi:hypothetical protein